MNPPAPGGDRPLRVLLFTTLFPSSARPGHGGFIETRLLELQRAGPVHARVVAPVPWFPSAHPRFGSWARMAATPRSEYRNGLHVLHPRYLLPPKVGQTIAPLMLALGAWGAVRRVRRSGFDFDVIDAHYFYPDGVAAALLARWARRPVVISARGSDLYVLGRDRLARRMMAWAADRAAASVGVCAALTDVLRAWGVPGARLHVLPNGVDLERFAPRDRDAARSATGVRGTPALLCVGNLVPIKGHALAIDVLARLLHRHPGATLTLVGEGLERKRLQQQASALGLAHAVRFAGRVPHDRLADWYSAADLTLLPSHSEGWANVLLESLACGVPVVSADVGGSAEVIREPVAGELLATRDAATWAAAIERQFLRHADRAAVRRYAEGFGWQRTAQAQLRLLHDVAAGAHA
jgi:glycosyltransferase involved in cell wall biosynthesis